MIIGAVKEIKVGENRVGITPYGVKALVDANHTLLVVKGVNTINGKCTYKAVVETFKLLYTPLEKAL
ncbi:MAG: hypothetical protein AAB600_00945 [Patescibacteria group bacterium]